MKKETKKGMKKEMVYIVSILLTIVVVAGCVEEELVPIADLPVLNNDLASGKLIIATPVEDFTFSTEYLTEYNTTTWRVTDSKNLVMKAYAIDTNKTVLVEHVHIDISIKSIKENLDGWTQDSMDDKLHTGSQIGFWITDEYPYENIFAIEGFSETLLSGWGWFIGGYGSLTMKEQRLTESNLIERGGVYGNKIQVVYDLLIKSDGEDYFHTRSVIDEFLIPIG